MRKVILIAVFFFFLLIPIYYFLYKIYIPKVNAFGCFDDCFNFLGGYFLLKGKSLYSEIFFNHQLIFPYLSYLIQKLSNPISVYDLVLKHRQFLLVFGFCFNFLLLVRFRWPALLFLFVYEFSKYYFFGDRFLAESFIVYPFAYLTGIAWNKTVKEKIYLFDYFLAVIFSWFIIFSREPYTFASLAIFFYIIFSQPLVKKKKIIFSLLFILLCLTTISTQNIFDYYFNVVEINYTVVTDSFKQDGNLILRLYKTFLYPVYLLFAPGEWTLMRKLLGVISILWIGLFGFLAVKKRSLRLIIASVIFLGLTNFRYAKPHYVFYGTFHMLPWFACFLIITFLAAKQVAGQKKNRYALFSLIIGLSLWLTMFSPSSFIKENPYTHDNYINNYGYILSTGNVFRALSNPGDTLFLDGFDDLIYWQSKMISPYPFSWYTSIMPSAQKYNQARLIMFEKNPPTFYYGSCPDELNPYQKLQKRYLEEYINILQNNKPTCLYVRKSGLKKISLKMRKTISEWGYTIGPVTK